MRSPVLVILVSVSLLMGLAPIALAQEDPASEEDAAPPEPVTPQPENAFPLKAWVPAVPGWAIAGVVAGVVATLVVGTSLTRPRPLPADPLLARAGDIGPGILRIPRGSGLDAAGAEQGRALAHRAAPASVEDALGLLDTLGFGSAHVVRESAHARVVRVTAPGSGSRAPRPGGCRFEAGFIQGTFEVVLGREVSVTESTCARETGGACEFTVRD